MSDIYFSRMVISVIEAGLTGREVSPEGLNRTGESAILSMTSIPLVTFPKIT